MSVSDYKAYSVEIFESSPGRYRARVHRLDGHKIKILTDNSREVASITTSGIAAFSVDDALALAKEMIDGGGME
jgi:hypothetical protein